MQDLKDLTNAEFTKAFVAKAGDERRITTEVLHYFREAERRMLYAEAGYPSLLMFAVKELKYSETSANRRITAMRLMRELPEIEEKIQKGDLNISVVTQVVVGMKKNDRVRNRKSTTEEKRETIQQFENHSLLEADRKLTEVFPEAYEQKSESLRAARDGGWTLETTLDQETYLMLEEFQNFAGRKIEVREILKVLVSEKVASLRKKSSGTIATANSKSFDSKAEPESSSSRAKPKQHVSRAKKQSSPNKEDGEIHDLISSREKEPPDSSNEKSDSISKDYPQSAAGTGENAVTNDSALKSRGQRAYISIHIERQIDARSGNQCEFVSSVSGLRCCEKRHLQTEHVIPVALGGTDDLENLQRLCSSHNKLRAVETFGSEKMERYMPSLRH